MKNNYYIGNNVKKSLNVKSLRAQIYDYLRNAMNQRELLPGSSINPASLSQQLGISKTPLRDALIQLEVEGFITILPRRGVIVNTLSLQDVKNAYEVVGALEASVIDSVFDKIDARLIKKMKQLNSDLINALNREDFDTYYLLNLNFHDLFLDLSDNEMLLKIIMPIKQRLYDFPRLVYVKEWERRNCNEHQQFIKSIEEGDRKGAASIMRDVHWSFKVQEKYIRKFYSLANGPDRD